MLKKLLLFSSYFDVAQESIRSYSHNGSIAACVSGNCGQERTRVQTETDGTELLLSR